MDILTSLISSLTPYEQQELEKFLHFKNPDKNSRDKVLFHILKEAEETSTDENVRTLYNISDNKSVSTNNKNAYYQLRYVLTGNVEDYTLQLIQKEDLLLSMIKLMLVARFLIQRKKYPAAYRYLLKAEEQATESQRYDLLDRIYQLQAEHAWLIPELDILEIEKKYKQNSESLIKEIKLNLALGNIRYVLTDARKRGDLLDIDDIVTQKMREYGVSTQWNESSSLCYKIATLVIAILSEKKDFAKAYEFLTGMYQHMEGHKMFDKHNSRSKIDILSHIVSSACHIRKFRAAEKYLKILKEEFEQRTDITIINLKSLMVEYVVLMSTGRIQEGLEHIQRVHESSVGKISKDDDYYNYAIFANLFSAHYMHGNITEAKKCLSKLLTKERAILNIYGMEGLLALHLVDCMLHLDRQDYEYVQFRLLAIQKRFAKFLNKSENERSKVYMGLLKELTQNPKCVESIAFNTKVERFNAMKSISQGSAEFLPFTPYLTSKVQKRSYYEILLEMVKEDASD